MRRTLALFLGGFLACFAAGAQQTGSISGTVTDASGSAVGGVAVEATSNVLPRPRATETDSGGGYRLPLLPPGTYDITFSKEGFAAQKRRVEVRLQVNTPVDVRLDIEAIEEAIQVVGEAVIDKTSNELKAAIGNETIDQLPVGQEYRDIQKLIPGVQYTEDSVRGPSAGGNGQDNVYLFDGVNVTLPLFGTLSAEPSSHDIDQVTVVKGGAKATDFNRSGGFTINTVSKTGTSQWRGELGYQIQTDGMTGNRDTVSEAEFESDRDWTTFNIGGPVVGDRLFFYGSYYRPTLDRVNRSNLYGEVPDLDSTRDEVFAKLTFTPTDSFSFHLSHRDSDREVTGANVGGEATAGTASEGSAATLGITTLEGSWVIDNQSFLSFKISDFENETASLPDTLFGFPIALGAPLDIANLDRQGLFVVPQPIAGLDDFNAFIQPLVDRYGFLENGARTGGGIVGGASTINDQDFFREGYQISYDRFIGNHELHFGYQWSSEAEDLARLSNGWGVISVPGNRDGSGDFFEARFEQMSLTAGGGTVVPPIRSEFEQQSIEFNDTIRLEDWTINLGFIASNDELYGQGLRPNSSNISGFELSQGSIYKMYEVDFDEQIAPRLGATWAYNDNSTLYANFARYYPAASSLPRAASWARNLRRSIRAFFDADGNFIRSDPVRSSSGKFFQEGLDPRRIDEYLVGTARRFDNGWVGRAHVRHRKGQDFWEDTNNDARSRFAPPPGIPTDDYIPNLAAVRAEIGGSSYVIAALDNAFTKYWEVSTEGEWRGRNAYFRGSYVWSHYYGNFDQDNSTTSNDANIFVGSSFIADGAGRQLWNFRYGNLRGDRRHQLKLYGFYNLSWNASVGAYVVYQDGQPWEAWNVEIYRAFTGSSSDTSRFAEPAGSRRTPDHYQLDLNYTQDFDVGSDLVVQVRADLFNALDKQTGYNIQNKVNSAGFGTPRSFFDPRRLQLAVKLRWR